MGQLKTAYITGAILTLTGFLALSSSPADTAAPQGPAAGLEDDRGHLAATRLKAELRRRGADSESVSDLLDAAIGRGPSGLEVILDALYPQMAGPPDGSAVAEAIRQLDSDDYGTCKKAAEQLASWGRHVRPALSGALAGAGPAARTWIQSILACLDEPQPTHIDRWRKLAERKIETIESPELLEMMVERVAGKLAEAPPKGAHKRILRSMIAALVRSRRDRYSRILAPLLKHTDTQVAVFLTEAVGSRRPNSYFPPLLLMALESDRPAVVEAAIRWAPNCWDKPRRREVYRLLRRIFKGKNEQLKFKACFPLMHDFADKEAIAYILSQTVSKDRKRAIRATSWIGDACNTGRPASPDLLENLVPYLKSDDNELRRAAADALGTYSGQDVIYNLIPLLTDPEDIIATEAFNNLAQQRDKAMLNRLLSRALSTAQTDALGLKIEELLKTIHRR
ncbi:MAG: HEAT repeat domain-containing protein [Planctomycetota bacterium]|jgi:HEAT repeat protein